MSPFDPIGDKARWRIIYDLLADLTVGDVITYETMAAATTLDPDADRHAIQMAMRRASKELETDRHHAVDPVPNVGYRIVEPAEQLGLAKRQQRRASKALVRGHSKVVNVDLNALEPDVRNAFQVVAQGFSMMMEMNRRLTGRQTKIEDAVKEMTGKQDRTDAEIAELQARLARLEQPPSED